MGVMILMETVEYIFGSGENLHTLQMSARAIVVFLFTLTLIRMGGFRIYGKRSAFDTIIIILLGSVLSRTINGASPFLPTIAASVTLIVMHRIVAYACIKSKFIERFIRGKHILLYKDGVILWDNLRKESLSQADIFQSLRLETKSTSLDRVKEAYMETNGRISFVMKEEEGE